ncbi:MAG: ATP-dependent DNA helicase [Lachnospiraceae bacterium]|nr:ATP-dependent DNA helicase [Robinsoniella sp.]MDY3766397.1 ATP-dependent DNA helicase [Lachnospiraceae bacterium]
MEEIRISVRNLVEFLMRSGDIDQRRGKGFEKDAMQMGSRLHRKIQKQMGEQYRAEVPLKMIWKKEDYQICIEGRADGIFEENGKSVIDEIKGVYRKLEEISYPIPVHLAQAKCYAYFYSIQCGKKQDMTVQMTYCDLETEEIKRFQESFSFFDLEEWFGGLMGQYERWAEFLVSWKTTRKESIKKLVFPFPYREGQKDLAAAVYRTILRKKKLFIQAPTGVGKTISAVFPAVKAVGEDLGDTIFYLTAKTITRTVAEEAFSILRDQGLRFKTVTLTAKEKLCVCEEALCDPVNCPRAKGHYDRVNDAVFSFLMERDCYPREEILRHAKKWEVCPFEFSLDLAVWVDGVICDYNYVFDPRASLKRFFGEGQKGSHLFLIDEAHNLVERGREMYSASLCKEDVLEAKKLVKPYDKALERKLEKCNKTMLAMKRECDGYEILENPGDLPIAVLELQEGLEKFLEESGLSLSASQGKERENDAEKRSEGIRERVLEFYFQTQTFLDVCDRLDENYVIYTQLEADGRFWIKLYCVNPAENLNHYLEKGNSTILFSGTFLPIQYYKSLLSTASDDYAIYAKSPFDTQKRLLLIGKDTTSRYTQRGERQYRKIAEYIKKISSQKKGNYLVFFPSYQMMGDVMPYFEQISSDEIEVICQTSQMSEEKREIFLESFEVDREKSLVGFCIIGGIFGEGIDLKAERLIGAIIVGTGLPQVGTEREILRQYYEKQGKDGFFFAYLCPGMNRVQQAAGRVIRTVEDTGVIALLDERFCMASHQSMFPREWEGFQICTLENVEEKVKNFWKNIS